MREKLPDGGHILAGARGRKGRGRRACRRENRARICGRCELMPTPAKSAKVIAEGGGKHWTAEELAVRAQAAEEMERETRVMLRAPDWLSDEAREVWNSVRRKLRGIELLDNLDTELLAIYCDAVVHYRKASMLLRKVDEQMHPAWSDEDVKAAQAWARIISGYAEKLGLSPAGRARLARKKSAKKTDDFADEFGG